MNKKEKSILGDLLKQYPELIQDKEKLKIIINLIKDNNPKIKIDTKFKKDLKLRLDSIIKYNRPKKIGFFSNLFLTPIISIFVVVGGIFYIYKDLILLKQNNINQFNIENINLDVLNSEEDNILHILNENENNNIIISPEVTHKIDNLNIKTQKINNKITKEKKINKANNTKVFKTIKKIETIKKTETKVGIVDDQIIEILGDTPIEDNILKDNNYPNEYINEESNIEINSYDALTINSNEKTFEEYCEDFNSKVIEKNGYKYCIIANKICMKYNYINNTCKLVQKK